MDHASEIRLLDYSKLPINQKNDNEITIFQLGVIFKMFGGCLILVVKLS